MAMRTKTCILCGAAPTTAAHLFASPIRAEYPNDKELVYLSEKPVDPGRVVRQSQRVGSGQVHAQPSVLCATCNGSWMSVIEQFAAPIVVRLLRGEAVTLSPQEQEAVASWAVAVAILRAELVPDAPPFDRADAQAFRNGSLGAAKVSVWLVNVEITIPGLVGGLATSSIPGQSDGASANICILWLRNICIVILQGASVDRSGRPLSVLRPAAQEIPQAAAFIWPPDRSVTDATLLDVLGLGNVMNAKFLNPAGRPTGRFTEQVLKVREGIVWDDLAREVMAHRVAEASKGPWPKPRGFKPPTGPAAP